jgi:hypothetical protein
MSHLVAAQAEISPLLLADRLITLAQDADRAGYSGTAGRLLRMAFRVCEEAPRTRA